MNNFLLVPIHTDALYLKYGTSVSEAEVEFNRLPYFSGKRDVNPDIVNLSEAIVSQPFQNKNLHLKAGVHLHWALPDALTRESDNGKFPAVPNCWLVTRQDQDGIEQWIVESDYLYSADERAELREDSVTYPYKDTENQNLPKFRYLGRKLTLEEWKNKQQENDPQAERLERLTAVGYGTPTFAALYPNCRSVFGFHDSKYAEDATLPDDLQYDVVGWYSDGEANYLSELLNNFKEIFEEDFLEEPLTAEAFVEAIKAESKWKFNWEDETFSTDEAPQIICHSRLTFKPSTSDSGQAPLEKANISLTVANTGTEALSAYLAETIDKSQKAIIEEQLEALQFAEDLESQKLDAEPKLQEIRHQAGFNAIAGGFLWRIRLETQQSNSNNKSAQAKLDLPPDIASLLTAVNQKQQKYDSALLEVDSRRRQLFSDWYKYMICTYPPEDTWDNYPNIDEVKYYIQKQGLEPLQEKLSATGRLDLSQDKAGNLSDALGSDSSQSSDLAQEINRLIAAVNAHNKKLQDEYDKLDEKQQAKASFPPDYRLEIVGGPRYWESKEPVVLIAGKKGDDSIKASQRHGQDGSFSEDGLLECEIIANRTIQDLVQENFKTVFDKIDKLEPPDNQERIGFSIWRSQPWNPILLEWLVEVFPVANGSNKTAGDRNYSNDFLTQNYALKTEDVDLSPLLLQAVVDDAETNHVKTDRDSNIYSGFSILTPYANSLLQKRIEAYLEKHDEGETATDNALHLVATAKKAQKILQNLNCLSQSLGGFNEALLMYKQTLQLAIEDLIGFDDYQVFTNEVAEAVAGETRSAPQPLDDFSPIRSGEMRIIDLQLIDTFGQVRNLDWKEKITTPTGMNTAEKNRIILPPRFVQPCRVNFRWLSANSQDNRETNDHPSTAPICGWILPNNLSRSLMIYSSQGQALGSININGEWDDAPGDSRLATTTVDGQEIPDISNAHLHQMVRTIITLGKGFVDNFNLCLNDALNNIDPENFAQNQSLALLIGRPIAVVRASVNLELQGLPAINQDWNIFRQEMQQARSLEKRDTDNFAEVKVPIRIGEYKQLNDGVIGYWKEQKAAASETGYEYENNIFYAQQSDLNESEKIETQDKDVEMNPEVKEGPINLIQSINSEPQTLTMLVDPRGVFHATSGILPSKSINIPAEQYAEALANIKITFLSAPILTSRTHQGRLSLPLPTAPDYDWTWLERKGRAVWSEISTASVIEQAMFAQSYSEYGLERNPKEDWQALLSQGWLAFVGGGNGTVQSKANIVNGDKRQVLTGGLAGLDELIEEIFDLHEISINPVAARAVFAGSQEIREGWLVLNQSPDAKTTDINANDTV